MAPSARVSALLLLVGSVALIIAATTMPWSTYYVGHSHWAQVEWVPFSRLVRPDDVLLNVLLFLPLGFSVYLSGVAGGEPHSSIVADAPRDQTRRVVRRRLLRAVVAAAILSTAVELFQVYCHGRLPTTVDIASNALGAWLGARWAAARIPSP